MVITISGSVDYDYLNNCLAGRNSDQRVVFPVSVVGQIDGMPELPTEIQQSIDAELGKKHPIATVVATLAALGGERVEVKNDAWDWSNGAPDTQESYQPLDLSAVKERLTDEAYEALIEGICDGIYGYNWVEAIASGSPDEIAEMNER